MDTKYSNIHFNVAKVNDLGTMFLSVPGGAIFGLFGSRTNRYGRDPIVLLGYIVHMIAFFLIFINIPEMAPIEGTDEFSYITPK